MQTLSQIRQRIASNLRRNDTTVYPNVIDDCIRSAITMYQGKPFWFLRKIENITLLQGESSVALPSDYASHPTFRIQVNNYWRANADGFDYYTDYQEFQQKFTDKITDGTPRNCSVVNGTLYTDKLASDDYPIEVVYFKKDVTLPVADTDISVWFDEGADAIRTQAMAMYKDEALEYEASDRDWARAAYYLNELYKQNNERF